MNRNALARIYDKDILSLILLKQNSKDVNKNTLGNALKQTLLLSTWLLFLSFLFASSSVRASEASLEQQEIDKAVTSLIQAVEQHYLHDETREKIVAHLATALENGAFNGYFPFSRLKNKLESMLFLVSKDSSFRVIPRAGLSDNSETSEIIFPGAIQTQLLENDIGYLAIDGDFINDDWQTEISKAMQFLSDSKALIIDLRTAGLTSIPFSQYFLSHFIPIDESLATLIFGDGKTSPILSISVANPLKNDIPLYIVTSPFVAGSWEFVANALKQNKQATIVGMPTMGLGFMTSTIPLSEHMSLVMAYAAFHHTDVNDSWVDSGVEPDIHSDSKNAMDVTLEIVNSAL